MNKPMFAKISETPNQTKWKFEFANGKTYRVTTYPQSKLVLIEDWSTGRKINARKAEAQIRECINS